MPAIRPAETMTVRIFPVFFCAAVVLVGGIYLYRQYSYTYQDCILDHAEGLGRGAGMLIYTICREKYSEPLTHYINAEQGLYDRTGAEVAGYGKNEIKDEIERQERDKPLTLTPVDYDPFATMPHYIVHDWSGRLESLERLPAGVNHPPPASRP